MPIKFIAAVFAALALCGCATVSNSWTPFPQQHELMSFADRWKASQHGGNQTEVAEMQRELVKYRDEIYERAVDRSKLDWDASGMATYGGLAAVIGALADRTGLLNTGAGLAAFGLTNSKHYRFREQSQIYVAALKRLSCITGKVNSASDQMRILGVGSSDQSASAASRNFINTVVASVDYVRTEYTNGLLGLTPSVPSREELLGLINTYRPSSVAPAAADAQQQAKDEAGAKMKALSEEVVQCSKL